MRQPVKRADDEPTAGPSTVALRIPALPEWVGVARLAIAGIASRSGFSVEDIEDLKLAVAEACTCCIQGPGGPDIKIECSLDDHRITVAVERAASNGARDAASALSADPAEVGGLGVFLIRSLMDDVTYVSDPASGTRLTLTKHIGN